MKRVCVFCGSSGGADRRFLEAAVALAGTLAGRGLGLVYGGASVGLMGAMADAALARGGHVTGVIPTTLVNREIAHRGLSDLRVVATMHERKALMADLSDAFIALPGGLGTLDESFEVLTWSQLGLHAKPFGLLDVAGYWQPLAAFLDHAVASGFIKPAHRALVHVEVSADALLDRLATARAGTVDKWGETIRY